MYLCNRPFSIYASIYIFSGAGKLEQVPADFGARGEVHPGHQYIAGVIQRRRALQT